ncbi:MAG: ribbon-helix-helix domain-containing protein [Candidatus Methanomethylicaceae archaeon]
MPRTGKLGIDGQEVLVKIPRDLLTEIDSLWPKSQCVSRTDFIRRALWEKVQRVKLLSERCEEEVAAPCS